MYRDYNALRALFFTAYLMTLQNPSIVPYDASFQVSFTATLGLILFGKHIEHQLKKFPRLFPERFEIRGLVTSTLATQIAVAPLLLYMMGDASVVSVIANIIVVPFIPATLLVIFCTGMSGFLLPLPGLLASISFYISFVAGAIAQVFLSYELLIVQFFGSFPYAIVTINNFSLWMMWCVYALYAIAYVFLKRYVKARDAARRKLPQNVSRSPPN
jgi:competence protein ComEC